MYDGLHELCIITRFVYFLVGVTKRYVKTAQVAWKGFFFFLFDILGLLEVVEWVVWTLE